MDINGMECCACTEISGLANYGTPQEALKSLCDQYSMWGTNGKMGDPGGFIIFTAKVKQAAQVYTYGQKFAAYLEANKLGQVMESMPAKNRKNHPTHTVKVWVWAPNPRTLRAWYAKHWNDSDFDGEKDDDDDDDGGW